MAAADMGCDMNDSSLELKLAVRDMLQKERELEILRRRVAELSGFIADKEQRKRKTMSPEAFGRACGL